MSLEWALIQYDWCPYKRGNLDTKADMPWREDNVERHREKMATYQPRNPAGSQKQGAGLEQRLCDHRHWNSGPADTLISGGLLASRTVRQSISVVLSHAVCGSLLQRPWGTNTWAVEYFLTQRDQHRKRRRSMRTSNFHQHTCGVAGLLQREKEPKNIWLEVGASNLVLLDQTWLRVLFSAAVTLLVDLPFMSVVFHFNKGISIVQDS